MAKKAPDTPDPPDPYETAGAQQQVNLNTALANAALNQYEEVTPYGRSYYEPTGQVRTFGEGGEYTGAGGGYDAIGGLAHAFGFPERQPGDPLTDDQKMAIKTMGFSPFAPGGPMGAGGGSGSAGGTFSIPMMRRITEFSPEQQRIFDAEMDTTGDLYDLANAYTGRVAEGLENPFTFEGLPDAPRADEGARQDIIDALYGQYKSRIDPEMEQDRRALEQRLANQGISIGSDAWDSEMDRYGRSRNDAYQSARNQAVTAGGAEQSRLFGLGASARERAIQERAYLRDRPINEITALTSGRGLTMPQFSAVPQVGMNAANLQGAVYDSHQSEMQAAQMAQQARSSMIGAITGLGGSLLGGAGAAGGFGKLFSDERLKENIHDTGISVDGVPVKTWDWRGTGEPDVGVIAQDVERKNPGAVDKSHPSGYRRVDYSKVFGLGAS